MEVRGRGRGNDLKPAEAHRGIKLEVDRRTGPTVQYLHKTARDFINSPKAQERLAPGSGTTFDPHLHLCSANFAICKIDVDPEFDNRSTLESTWPMIP